MQCPDCGDSERQERLPFVYTSLRCGKCGRIHVQPADDNLCDRIARLEKEQTQLLQRIAELEAQLAASRVMA